MIETTKAVSSSSIQKAAKNLRVKGAPETNPAKWQDTIKKEELVDHTNRRVYIPLTGKQILDAIIRRAGDGLLENLASASQARKNSMSDSEFLLI
jgi:hypothetical protein